jgi:hypothetical protein
MTLIDLPEVRNQLKTLVNTIVNLQVPLKYWIILLVAAQLAVSQEGLSSMEFVSVHVELIPI